MNSRFACCAAAVSAVCLASLTGCGKAPHTTSPPGVILPLMQIKAVKVEVKSTESFQEVSGTVRAKLRAALEAKTSGRIIALPVEAGQQVRSGDLIARLDAPEIKARVDLAEANLTQAEREWKRVSALQAQQAATRAEFEAAEARHLAAQALLAEAKAMLGYIEISAPFDGVVARKIADVGDLATPGKPLIEFEDPSKLQVQADVPEVIALKIASDSLMSVRIGDDVLDARVSEISPVADPATRTFRVKLDLPAGVRALSGQFARLLVPLGKTGSIFVPNAALVRRGQMDIVFVAEDGKARLHLVKTGRSAKDDTEILSGLDSGDMVITEGASLVVDGQPVELK